MCPHPGSGLKTVTLPSRFWTSAAVICAVNWPALLKTVVRGLPFQLTTALAAKFRRSPLDETGTARVHLVRTQACERRNRVIAAGQRDRTR